MSASAPLPINHQPSTMPPMPLLRKCFQQALKLSDEEASEIGMETGVWNFAKWNSLGHLALILALEREFGIRFDESETAELVSIETIVKAIETRKTQILA